MAATPARFDLVLGRFAPQGWYEGGKICLFRAGALAGGKLDLQVVLNETFLRF